MGNMRILQMRVDGSMFGTGYARGQRARQKCRIYYVENVDGQIKHLV